jgi:hypothetical protein
MKGSTGKYSGTGVNDNDVLFTTGRMNSYDTFMLESTVGAVDVQVTLDGTNWTTAALAMTDLGAITSDPVLVTVAGRMYGFKGKYQQIRVLQNGATAATATLRYGNT